VTERQGLHFLRDKIQALRALIRSKIADGRLPHDSSLRVWGGRSGGDVCTACDGQITKDEFVLGGVYLVDKSEPVQFHVMCFWLWDAEVRRPPESASSRPRLYVVRPPPLDCAYCGNAIGASEESVTREALSYHADCAPR
jgi:hypothetical protein